MKTLVVYSTVTGNTRKIANVLADELGTTAKNIDNVSAIDDTELLVVGSGCYRRSPSKKIVKFLNGLGIISDLNVILFGTYGYDDDALREMADILKAKSANIIGRWGCKGSLLYILHNRGLPSEEDVAAARKFIRDLKVTKKI